jgi:hypothetical protein
MAQLTINPPPRANMPFNTGDSIEFGDQPAVVVSKLNSMFTDQYNGVETGQGSIVAGTTRTQAGATALAQTFSRVDTSTAPAAGTILGDGVMLLPATAGDFLVVINNTANIIQVYGNGSDTVNGVAGATGVALPQGDAAVFFCASAGVWNYEAGVGSSGQLAVQLALTGLTAAGTNQGNALQLVADLNELTTVSAGTGVILPIAKAGLDVIVCNHGANAVTVYGNGSDLVQDVASVNQMAFSTVIYTCYGNGNWYSEGLGSGFASVGGGAFTTSSYADSLTASATQTQAGGTPITASIAGFSTVGGAGNAATLPPSRPGMIITVINETATSMQVFPASQTQGGATGGDLIKPGAQNASINVTNAAPTIFYCMTAGTWWTK